MPQGRNKNNKEISLFGLLGSLFGLSNANAAALPNKITIQTKGLDQRANTNNGQGFQSLAEKINFGGGFR